VGALGLGLGGSGSAHPVAPVASRAESPRRPQAIALLPDTPAGEALLVGNRTGTVSVVRTEDLTLLGEAPAGGNITGLELLPDGSGRVVAVDHGAHELLVLRPADGPWTAPGPFPAAGAAPMLELEAAVPTCRYPIRVVRRGSSLAVSCLWSRQVRLYELTGRDAVAGDLETPHWTAELPFEPQEMVFLDDGKLLVADAFGGGLAIASTGDGALLRVTELTGHNLRGLTLLPDGRIGIAHQELHTGMHTTSDDIRWGVFITNSVSLMPVDDLVSGNPRLGRRTRIMDLGDVLTPSGDPAAMVVSPEGELVIALSGVGRLAFGSTDARRMSHARVGRGPSAIAPDGNGLLYVANTRSDEISVVALSEQTELVRVPLGPAAPLTAAERGELLFHDASLSLRGWMSCASCHTGGHTNHRLSDTLGDGHYGAPKRVLSLLGVADTRPWAWDGQIRELEDQVEKSVRTTLRGRELEDREVTDLAAYLRTLELPEVSEPPATELVAAGREAFDRYTCNRCHTAPVYTSPGVHNVGLADELGNDRFNPPSLRGVKFRRALLHDGSAKSLEEVFEVHPGFEIRVSEADLPALIAFLRTL
jgi:mono/diheme cytochrome c family protein